MKLGHGGIKYIANLLACSRTTIHAGIEEIMSNDFPPPERVRRKGGGRKPIEEVEPNIEQEILKILETILQEVHPPILNGQT